MLIRGCRLAVLGAALALAVPALASADVTIGSAALPAPSSYMSGLCAPIGPGVPVVVELSSDASTPYAVPSGAWELTHWQLNVTGATAGAQATFVVLRPRGGGASYLVLGADTESVPSTLPAGGIASFTLAAPILVQPGDTIGLYAPTAPSLTCIFSDTGAETGVPTTDTVAAAATSSSPTAGQTLSVSEKSAGGGYRLNLAATLTQLSYDAGLSLASGPANAIIGQPAVLTATVTNHGPAAGSITFVDPVPAGLPVQYAGADSGDCSTSALNIVTCTFSGMAVGQSSEVTIVVAPTAAQTYTDAASVSVRDGATDPNAANNSATTTLNVTAAPAAARCVVPKLGGASVALAKKVLPLLGCKVGKITNSHSKSVPKGEVISTNPRAGTYAAGWKIGLTVSSGKPPKKKRKK
jgi:uncharacterized repeat protein (TIGR01451 family)